MAADNASPQPTTIQKLTTAVYPSFAMLAGMQLDVFTPLKDGPMAAEQLANALGVKTEKLSPLLYTLVAAELLTVEGNQFANTPEAHHFLVKDKPTYMGGQQGNLSRWWHAILETSESIRAGTPQSPIDFADDSPDALEATLRRLHAGLRQRGKELIARYDISDAQTLADVGGGSGGLAIAITEVYPHLCATVIDLPSITPITQRLIEEEGATQRVNILATDVVNNTIPKSFDIAVLDRFIQVLSADEARRAISHIYQALNPSGEIFIRGAILDNSRLSPTEMVGFGLYFLNSYLEGGTYTEQEHLDWLESAGFVEIERTVLPDAWSFIRARKPA